MPTSILIPDVYAKLREMKPQSIIEIGPGFGKFGMLAREYLELWGNRRYARKDWKVRIDAIEVCEHYIGGQHGIFYNDVIIGNAVDYIDRLIEYDVVVMLDVIEHIGHHEGRAILNAANSYIVTTPAVFNKQGAVYNNEHERHVTLWKESDFENSVIINSPIEEVTPIIMGWKNGK